MIPNVDGSLAKSFLSAVKTLSDTNPDGPVLAEIRDSMHDVSPIKLLEAKEIRDELAKAGLIQKTGLGSLSHVLTDKGMEHLTKQ